MRLMGIDESHAIAGGIAAQYAGLAQRQRLQRRKEFVLHIVGRRCSAAAAGIERRMDIETGASAGAGYASDQRRVGVGDKDHVRHVADQRLQRVPQFAETLRQVARQRRA